MDNDLLEKEKKTETFNRVPDVTTNNEDEVAEPQYRELELEPRKPPLRITFNPPIEYDGKSYRELVFDFDSMTGKDFIRAEREFQHLYKPERNEIVLPEMKHLFHNLILAHLANVPYTLIQRLDRRYYVPLRTEALKACGSSPEEEKV
jgi:hypothetical protein